MGGKGADADAKLRGLGRERNECDGFEVLLVGGLRCAALVALFGGNCHLAA